MTGRILLIAALTGLTAGCQGTGPLLSRQTSLGSLKTSVSQLEFQNEQLQKQVADLKADNRRLDDRLVQEQAETDDLANRLSDAKNLLGEQGKEFRAGTASKSSPEDGSPDNPPPKVRRAKRTPPAVVIPGRMEPAQVPADDEVGAWDPPAKAKAIARRTLDDRWLPVARGVGSGEGTIK